jgi:hypothetical protein
MFSVYRILLYLYPPACRSEFGEEMLAVFRAAQTEAWKKDTFMRTRFCAREITGLVAGALSEHVRTIAGFDRPPLIFSRRFNMRSEFRFPKITVTLMTIILAGVVLAIEKATAIEASVPDFYQHVGPIQPAHFTFLPTMLVILGGACLAGAIGWAILFALHRSGLHRLAEFDPASHQGSGGRTHA